MSTRRELIALLGGAAATWPATVWAQQPPMPVVGFLNSASANAYPHLTNAFRQGLSEGGFVEGRNVTIEYRWANNNYDRLPALAADLVDRRVSVIAATGASVKAASAATTTIPIVFNRASDPVQDHTVSILNRPGGNLTGVTSLNYELGPKQLQLLQEMVPAANEIGVLINPTNFNAEAWSTNLQSAGNSLRLPLNIVHASSERDFDGAFATLLQRRAGGLLIANDPFITSHIALLAALTIRHALPAIYGYREFAASGGLMSYGASLSVSYRLVGNYTSRILKGDKPADLPVQQATKVELVINMRTAKALGLTVPITLLGRADEVIE